jgi:uncharacterized membrane protein YdbT with pleckstrin-like domain
MSLHLEPGEQPLKIIRKHWLSLALQALFFCVLALAPLGIMLSIGLISQVQTLVSGANLIPHEGFIIYGYSLWLLILWIGFFIAWTNYVLDYWVITNERLIDVEQISLFSRKVSALSLDRIQDVTVETHGIVHSLLHIGTLHVQTAGAQKEFHISDIHFPYELKNIILASAQRKADRIKTVRIAQD